MTKPISWRPRSTSSAARSPPGRTGTAPAGTPLTPSAKQDLADLARHGSGDVYFLSDSADRRKASVFFERDSESGEFALLDRERREVRKLLVQRKARPTYRCARCSR